MAKQNEKQSSISKRIATDPKFERTRENIAEFGRASKAGKLVSDSLRMLVYNTSDKNMISRLTREMYRVIKADSISDRGERNVVNGNVLLLSGFEFNRNAKITAIFFATYTTTIDRVTGTLKTDIPTLIPKSMIKAPPETTHFSLTSRAVEIDFATGTHTIVTSYTLELVYGTQTEPAISLSHVITANSNHPLFLALGIKFFQEINGKRYPLYSGKFNALALVNIDYTAPAPVQAA